MLMIQIQATEVGQELWRGAGGDERQVNASESQLDEDNHYPDEADDGVEMMATANIVILAG